MRNTVLIRKDHRNPHVACVILNRYYQDSFHYTRNTLKDSMAVLACSKCLIIYNYPFMLQRSGYEMFHPLLEVEGGKEARIFSKLGVCEKGAVEWRHTKAKEV